MSAYQRWYVETFLSKPSSTGGPSGYLHADEVKIDEKLISGTDWPGAPDPAHGNLSRWWLIAIHGEPTVTLAKNTVSWVLAWVNAETGKVRLVSHGSGASPSRLATVTDHAADCIS